MLSSVLLKKGPKGPHDPINYMCLDIARDIYPDIGRDIGEFVTELASFLTNFFSYKLTMSYNVDE